MRLYYFLLLSFCLVGCAASKGLRTRKLFSKTDLVEDLGTASDIGDPKELENALNTLTALLADKFGHANCVIRTKETPEDPSAETTIVCKATFAGKQVTATLVAHQLIPQTFQVCVSQVGSDEEPTCYLIDLTDIEEANLIGLDVVLGWLQGEEPDYGALLQILLDAFDNNCMIGVDPAEGEDGTTTIACEKERVELTIQADGFGITSPIVPNSVEICINDKCTLIYLTGDLEADFDAIIGTWT